MAVTKEEKAKRKAEREAERLRREELFPGAKAGGGGRKWVQLSIATGSTYMEVEVRVRGGLDQFKPEHSFSDVETAYIRLGPSEVLELMRALAARYNHWAKCANEEASACGLIMLSTAGCDLEGGK